MTEQSSNSGRDEWGRDGYVPGEQYYGEQYGPGYGSSGQGGPGYGSSGQGGQGGQGGPGYEQGATRPVPSPPGQGTPGSPLWQAAPGPGGQGPGGQGQPGAGYGAPPPAGAQPRGAQPMSPAAMSARGADARGFMSSLFDFSFTSFVTTRIIKVLYVLILILTVLTALVYTLLAFNANALFGLLTLVIGDPLFIIIVMAFWRLVLESFVVVFRIAEDVHALRERGER